MQQIIWDDFAKVELRVGCVLSADPLPNARRPAYVLQIDFGPDIGVKKSKSWCRSLRLSAKDIGFL